MGCHLKGLKWNVKTIASFWTYCNHLLIYISYCYSIRYAKNIEIFWLSYTLLIKYISPGSKTLQWFKEMHGQLKMLHLPTSNEIFDGMFTFFVASQRIRLMNRFILSKSCEQYGFTAVNFCSIILTYIQFKRIVVSMLFFVSYNH